jgi:hypothetical protein
MPGEDKTQSYWVLRTSYASAFFEPMKAEEVIDALTTRFAIDTRAKFKQEETPSKWGWFLVPVPGYAESSAYGPVPIREIEWVEINPIEQRRIGRLVPPHIIDHTPTLLQQLAVHGIPVQVVEGRIRIAL